MRLDKLIPQLAGLVVKRIVLAENSITLIAAARGPTARCPCCHQWSARVQSRYWRAIADVPLSRRSVRLHLQVRRFRCTNEACPRRIFAEQFPRLVARYARRTLAQSHMLEEIALALGGQAGARLAAAPRCTDESQHALAAVEGTPHGDASDAARVGRR